MMHDNAAMSTTEATPSTRTSVWSRRYLGALDPALEAEARSQGALLYILTSHDGVLFVDDGLRDGETVRAEMTGWFRDLLGRIGAQWVEVTGDHTTRVTTALEWIHDAVRTDPLFSTGP